MYRRYYSMNDMPKLVTKQENLPEKSQPKKPDIRNADNKSLFSNLELDDIILGIVILAILLDDGDDTLLLLALLAVFLTGHI